MGTSLQTCKQAAKREWKHISFPHGKKFRNMSFSDEVMLHVL
jgi:hypothetical protein